MKYETARNFPDRTLLLICDNNWCKRFTTECRTHKRVFVRLNVGSEPKIPLKLSIAAQFQQQRGQSESLEYSLRTWIPSHSSESQRTHQKRTPTSVLRCSTHQLYPQIVHSERIQYTFIKLAHSLQKHLFFSDTTATMYRLVSDVTQKM